MSVFANKKRNKKILGAAAVLGAAVGVTCYFLCKDTNGVSFSDFSKNNYGMADTVSYSWGVSNAQRVNDGEFQEASLDERVGSLEKKCQVLSKRVNENRSLINNYHKKGLQGKNNGRYTSHINKVSYNENVSNSPSTRVGNKEQGVMSYEKNRVRFTYFNDEKFLGSIRQKNLYVTNKAYQQKARSDTAKYHKRQIVGERK